MEKLLRCRDLGMDCDFEVCRDTPEEVLKTAIDHDRAVHGLKDIPEKNRIRAKATIQDAFVSQRVSITQAEESFIDATNQLHLTG